jgi:AcrR family transcriptional regulator
MSRKKSIDRDRILDAAEEVILQRGSKALTLDAVAAHAKISKGGLTYTFATKDALLKALLDRDFTQFQATLEQLAKSHSGAAQPELHALIDASRKGMAPARARVAEIMAALMHSPASLASVHVYFKWLLSHVSSSAPGDSNARIAFYAMQGAFFLHGFGLVKLTNKTRNVLQDDIVNLLLKAGL